MMKTGPMKPLNERCPDEAVGAQDQWKSIVSAAKAPQSDPIIRYL
jgi:hypothetical protein